MPEAGSKVAGTEDATKKHRAMRGAGWLPRMAQVVDARLLENRLLLTCGSPLTHGLFYDVSYDRSI